MREGGRKREKANWNSKLVLSKVNSQAQQIRIVRKLQEIGQEFMGIQNDLAEPPNNPEDVQRVDGLVEDIHYALMDYQVGTPHQTCSHSVQHLHQTSFRQDIYDKSCQEIVSLTPTLSGLM